MLKKMLKAIDIFKAKQLSNLEVEKDKLILKLDEQRYELSYDDITPMEALLLRLNSKVEVLLDTSPIFEDKEEDNKS